jgi:hypothetical protein
MRFVPLSSTESPALLPPLKMPMYTAVTESDERVVNCPPESSAAMTAAGLPARL